MSVVKITGGLLWTLLVIKRVRYETGKVPVIDIFYKGNSSDSVENGSGCCSDPHIDSNMHWVLLYVGTVLGDNNIVLSRVAC